MTQNASFIELTVPAGSLTMLETAMEVRADTVYLGLKNTANMRDFAGLNFTESDIRAGVEFAHRKGRQVLFVINAFPQPGRAIEWHIAANAAYMLGTDVMIPADPGLVAYTCERHSSLRLHLSMQGSATHADAIELVYEQFDIYYAVLPCVLTLTEVERVIQQTSVQIEVFGFGSLCMMTGGRCLSLLYATGDSPNNRGAYSPAHTMHWVERDGSLDARLNNIMVDRYAPGEPAEYPTLCKGHSLVGGEVDHVLKEPTSLNTSSPLPRSLVMSVSAIKIEGRQRSPAYVAQVIATLRAALDATQADPTRFSVKPDWQVVLVRHVEGAYVA